MIPKQIVSLWLGDNPPELIKKCLATQKIPGFTHHMITLENCHHNRYVDECLNNTILTPGQRYTKAADYLRMHYLYEHGGIFLDPDVEIVRSFTDDLLEKPMFVGVEENGFVSNAIVGAEAGHPVLADYLGKVDRNYIGTGELIFPPGMYLWTELTKFDNRVMVYPTEWFLPFNWQSNTMRQTENTYTIHYFNRGWIKKEV